MSGHDLAGEPFKALEEAHRTVARGGFLVVRVDGKAFHTYTRGMDKPCDWRLLDAMVGAMVGTCEGDMPAVLAYTQSDEISFVLDQRTGEGWFGSQVQKVVSVAASQVTALFNAPRPNGSRWAFFDARVTPLASVEDVRAYLRWRFMDALRNSVSATAHASFGRSKLHGVPISGQKAMLRDAGHAWEDSPPEWRGGVVAFPVTAPETVTYVDKRTGESHTADAIRTRWFTRPMVDFDIDGWDRQPRRSVGLSSTSLPLLGEPVSEP